MILPCPRRFGGLALGMGGTRTVVESVPPRVFQGCGVEVLPTGWAFMVAFGGTRLA